MAKIDHNASLMVYTKNSCETDNNLIFIFNTFTVLNTMITISFMVNFDKEEYLNLQVRSNLNNQSDEKYFNDLSEWNKKILVNEHNQLSKENKNFLNEIFMTYDDKLRERGYLKYIVKEG